MAKISFSKMEKIAKTQWDHSGRIHCLSLMVLYLLWFPDMLFGMKIFLTVMHVIVFTLIPLFDWIGKKCQIRAQIINS